MVVKIIRLFLALSFLLSSITKAVNIPALAMEVRMYSDAYLWEWLRDYATPIAVMVCAAELMVGVGALIKRTARYALWVMIVMLVFFVWLTGVNLFFPTVMGSIESCGCFGELIHFSPTGSFVKSLVLFAFAVYADVKANRNKTTTDLTDYTDGQMNKEKSTQE